MRFEYKRDAEADKRYRRMVEMFDERKARRRK
jgi:hypothetical protein